MHICNTLPTTSHKLKEPKPPTIDATTARLDAYATLAGLSRQAQTDNSKLGAQTHVQSE